MTVSHPELEKCPPALSFVIREMFCLAFAGSLDVR